MAVRMQVFGVQDLLAKLQDMGADVEAAATEALQASADRVTADLQRGIARHHRTGRTEGALRKQPQVEEIEGKLSVKVGFDMPEGLPARYINYGTPTNKPDPFITRALNKTRHRKEMEAVLERIVNGS